MRDFLKLFVIALIAIVVASTNDLSAQSVPVTRKKTTTTTTPAKKTATTTTKPAKNKTYNRPAQNTPKIKAEENVIINDEDDDEEYVSISENTVTYNANNKELRCGLNVYKFVKVEPYSFVMGATEEQVNPETIEEPTHRVSLYTFFIGATEVPQWLWQAVMGYNPSTNVGSNLPVETVSWNECMEFINKLSEITGRGFNLPTEAKWEVAARGKDEDSGYQYSGSNNIDDVAWYVDNASETTHPVGTKEANQIGLYDMSGNVGEWCSDWFEPYTSARVTDPKGPAEGKMRVFRSGNYMSTPNGCRVAKRYAEEPDYKAPHLGLRLVLK